MAFSFCSSLKKLFFPNDSQLERIEAAFQFTSIKHLLLPPSIKVIDNAFDEMCKLESVHVINDLYTSNEEGTAILSKDRRDLICVIPRLEGFIIPDGVLVIRKNAFYSISIYYFFIPKSVEAIEEGAFCC